LELVSRAFDRALTTALDRLADRAVRNEPQASAAEALADSISGVAPESYLAIEFFKALERNRTRLILTARAGVHSVEGDEGSFHGLTSNDLQTPRLAFITAARGLGFMDAEIDSDGTSRRLPLVARRSGEFYVHQALAAVTQHLDCK